MGQAMQCSARSMSGDCEAKPVRRCKSKHGMLGIAGVARPRMIAQGGSGRARRGLAGTAGYGGAQYVGAKRGAVGRGRLGQAMSVLFGTADAWRGLAGDVRRGGAWRDLGRVLVGSGLAGWVLHDLARIVRRGLARLAWCGDAGELWGGAVLRTAKLGRLGVVKRMQAWQAMARLARRGVT